MPEQQQPIVSVRGEAVREVPPETASFTATVVVSDRDKESVLAGLAARAAELRAALDGFGESIERRETSQVEVYPEVRGGRERRTVAWVGRVATTVTTADFPVLGEMLLGLAALAQVSVSGPWWQLRPGSTAGSQVRRAAIEDALARAREYASAVGARVDRLIEIADEGAGGGGEHMRFAMAAGMAEDAGAGLELDPQQQTVRASVVVRVGITPPDLAG
jgi:uncharacterized protein YggE